MKNTKKEKNAKGKLCMCPYCEEELIIAPFPFCHSCGLAVHHCLTCQITVLDAKVTKCPQCGGPLTKGGKKENV